MRDDGMTVQRRTTMANRFGRCVSGPRPILSSLLVIVALGMSATAAAQTADGRWQRGTAVSGFSGAGWTSGSTTSVFGGAIGWDINEWTALEGAGSWLFGSRTHEAFAAELKVLANVRRPAVVVPFVGGGVGLYHASLGAGQAMPGFYRRRMVDRPFRSRSDFTDPSLIVATGVSVSVSSHVSIRPDVSVRFVMRDSRSLAVGMATVVINYRFVERPVGGSR
jgi:hypothetical protein